MCYLITPLLTFLSGKWFFRIAVSSPQRPWSKAKVSILFLLFGSYQPHDKALLVTGFCESEELAHIQSQGASSQVPWSACHFFFLTQDFFLSQCVLRWPAAENLDSLRDTAVPKVPSPPTLTCSLCGPALSDPFQKHCCWLSCYSRGETAQVSPCLSWMRWPLLLADLLGSCLLMRKQVVALIWWRQ